MARDEYRREQEQLLNHRNSVYGQLRVVFPISAPCVGETAQDSYGQSCVCVCVCVHVYVCVWVRVFLRVYVLTVELVGYLDEEVAERDLLAASRG